MFHTKYIGPDFMHIHIFLKYILQKHEFFIISFILDIFHCVRCKKFQQKFKTRKHKIHQYHLTIEKETYVRNLCYHKNV